MDKDGTVKDGGPTVPPPPVKPGEFSIRQKDYRKCVYPQCQRTFEYKEGEVPFCKDHRRFMSDVIFSLQSLGLITVGVAGEVKKTGGPPPQGQGPQIFVPKPGMGDKAVQEARDARNTPGGKPQ